MVKLSKNFDFGQNFEKFWFHLNFRKKFSQIFEKISILVNILGNSYFRKKISILVKILEKNSISVTLSDKFRF